MQRETLKADPERLQVLQRKFQSLHSQSRGVWQQIQDAEQRRTIVDNRLAMGRRRAEEWKRWQAAPTSIRFMSEAQTWGERLNATGTEGLADDEAELAELDDTVSNLQRTYDGLMAIERPMSQLLQACEAYMGRPHRVLRAVVANAVGADQGSGAPPSPAADAGASHAIAPPSGQAMAAPAGLSPQNRAFSAAIDAMRGGAARLLGRGQ